MLKPNVKKCFIKVQTAVHTVYSPLKATVLRVQYPTTLDQHLDQHVQRLVENMSTWEGW